jgi:hypothetical protein
MSKLSVLAVAVLAGTSVAQAASVGVDEGGTWLGYMNVFNLPADGGGFQFGSPWGIGDLNANFNLGTHELKLSPNTIGDPNGYWYIGGGGPGAAGNKIMEANLYQEFTDVYNGQTLNFSGNVLSNSFTSAHKVYAFIKDFAADYSSFNITTLELTAPGAFSINLNTDAGAGRHVQWGFQTVGVNVWTTDTAPFGNMVIATIPAPASLALVGMGVLASGRRRRA